MCPRASMRARSKTTRENTVLVNTHFQSTIIANSRAGAFQDNTREHSIRISQHTQENTVLVNTQENTVLVKTHILSQLESGRALQCNITPIHQEKTC